MRWSGAMTNEEKSFDWDKRFITVNGKPARMVCADFKPYGHSAMECYLVLVTHANGREGMCLYQENGETYNRNGQNKLENIDAPIDS